AQISFFPVLDGNAGKRNGHGGQNHKNRTRQNQLDESESCRESANAFLVAACTGMAARGAKGHASVCAAAHPTLTAPLSWLVRKPLARCAAGSRGRSPEGPGGRYFPGPQLEARCPPAFRFH